MDSFFHDHTKINISLSGTKRKDWNDNWDYADSTYSIQSLNITDDAYVQTLANWSDCGAWGGYAYINVHFSLKLTSSGNIKINPYVNMKINKCCSDWNSLVFDYYINSWNC